jgi:hypothetical protein
MTVRKAQQARMGEVIEYLHARERREQDPNLPIFDDLLELRKNDTERFETLRETLISVEIANAPLHQIGVD